MGKKSFEYIFNVFQFNLNLPLCQSFITLYWATIILKCVYHCNKNIYSSYKYFTFFFQHLLYASPVPSHLHALKLQFHKKKKILYHMFFTIKSDFKMETPNVEVLVV